MMAPIGGGRGKGGGGGGGDGNAASDRDAIVTVVQGDHYNTVTYSYHSVELRLPNC